MRKYLLYVFCTLNVHSIATQYRHGIDNNHNGDHLIDTDDIHYYIWNDLNKRDNFYPNILHNVQNEFQYSATPIDNNHHHKTVALSASNGPITYSMNSNTRPPSTISSNQLLTNEMYRSSDSIAIPLLDYAVQQSLLMDKLSQHDRYLRNRSKLNHPYTWNLPKALKPPDTTAMTAKWLRPNLREMFNDKNVHTFKYYSNLPKSKSLSDAIDHHRGEHAVIKEPMVAKQYSTFEMLEPIPQRVILPPVFDRIPEFKPVPPQLQVIPVVSEYLAKYPNQILSYYRPATPFGALVKDSKTNFPADHRKALPNPPARMIPFSLADAVTWRSTVHSITSITTTETPRTHQLRQGLLVPDKYQSDIISTLGPLDPPHYKEIPVQQIQSNEATIYRNKVNDSSASETVMNIERSKKRRNKLSNYKQKLRSYEKSIHKLNTNDMNTISENDIYDIRPVRELVTDEDASNKWQEQQQQHKQIPVAGKIQLSDAYSRQTSNVIVPVYPERHSVNDDNRIQATTIQSTPFLIAIPDDDDLMPDESTRSSKRAGSELYSMSFNDRNGEIRKTSAPSISVSQTKPTMREDEVQKYQMRDNPNQVAPLTPEERYKKWFDDFKEKNRQKGKPIYSEYFRKVEIQPNIQWTEPKNHGHSEKWSTDETDGKTKHRPSSPSTTSSSISVALSTPSVY